MNQQDISKLLFQGQDKVALVTGAASGIGKAVTVLFCEVGIRVVAVDIDCAAGKHLTEELNHSFGEERVLFVGADVRSRADCQRAASACLEWAKRIDVLVASAGLVRPDGNPLCGNAFDMVMDTNVRGILNTVEAVRPSMVRARRGSIVLIGSIVASHGWAERAVYCASKGAVHSAMRAFAMELAVSNIRVNAVAPGLVWTPLIRRVVSESDDHQRAFRYRSVQQASGRMLSPNEVARHALFLASELSAGICGAILDGSGGRLAGHVPDMENPGPDYAEVWEEVKTIVSGTT